MQPSSNLCRSEEARQRTVERDSKLENVKRVAGAAAAAWAKEGKIAEQREGRKLRTREIAAGLKPDAEPPSMEERSLSENPDRGHASVTGGSG